MTFWYMARAGGLVSWLLLAFSMVLGVGVRLRSTDRRLAGPYLLELHRHTAVVAVGFVVLHLYGLVADPYVEFTPADLVVPFRSEWSPWAVTWGVFALYLLVITQVSGQLRRRLPLRWWVWLHRSSYALFVVASAHGLTAGTDALNLGVLVGAVALSLLVVAATSLRLIRSPSHRPARR